MPTPAAKTARLEARVSSDQKSLIERAAALEGRTVSDFVVQTLQRAARTVIEEYEVWRLDREQSADFVERLLKPTAPNRALKRAAKQHRERVETR